MKLMFLPVTIIEGLPHVLLHYNFSRKKDRYFLSPHEVEISRHGLQRTVCDLIHSSDFLCALLDIDRSTIAKSSIGSTTTNTCQPEENEEQITRRALSSSTVLETTNTADLLSTMIEQRLDFKHKCMFYSAGLVSDLCGTFFSLSIRFSSVAVFLCTLVCALDVDHNSSVGCNAIGYEDIPIDELNIGQKLTHPQGDVNAKKRTPKMCHQHRQFVHQWLCIRDIVDGLITCHYTLTSETITEILAKMHLWCKQRTGSDGNPIKERQPQSSVGAMTNVKLYKSQARQLVWDLMEMKNEVRFPRPSHGRIPNLRYSELAAENVTSLECFKRARIIKINPSLAQESLRYLTLTYNKILLTPMPALESVLFYKLDAKNLRPHQFEWAATKSGAAELGTIVQLLALKQLHVDIVVVASVAVNPVTGARIGKGKGYGDLEYAIMCQMGCVTGKTIVLTTCHESQLINDLPKNVMEQHDLPVDIIVTPKRFIYTKRLFQRPDRVYWDKVDADMMANIPVLRELRELEEQDSIIA